MAANNIYDFIKQEQAAYRTQPVPLADGWEWNMYEHIRKSFLYKHSKFSTGTDDGNRPFKNIVKPILNVAYRSEGFDVKDITPFVNDEKNYYKSFLVRKFHPKWARKNNLDTFLDELVESYVDFGLALVKNVKDVRPEVVPLQRIAFCDQTDILSGPLGELHYYTSDQLREMGWDEEMVEVAIERSENQKTPPLAGNQSAKTPGKFIEVYEVHGSMPESWLDDEEGSDGEYVHQMQIVTFYQDEDGKPKGLTLFKGKDEPDRYKAIKRDPVYGRACGYGGVEELFEPQTWINYNEIQLKEMLDVASMIIMQTADNTYTGQRLTDLEKGEILVHEVNAPLTQATIQPQNHQLFQDREQANIEHARLIGSADEALTGESPSSGTPFRLQALVTQEGKGLHVYRQGKISDFVAQLYRDWILDYVVDEINKGQQFLEDLSAEEMQEVADAVVTNLSNRKAKDALLRGRVPTSEELELFKDIVRTEFTRAGKSRFMEVIRDELKNIPVDVEVNIAGRQKDLADQAEKLTNIFRAVIASPEALQNPEMAKLFNQILEASDFSPINFAGFSRPSPVQPQLQQANQQPQWHFKI